MSSYSNTSPGAQPHTFRAPRQAETLGIRFSSTITTEESEAPPSETTCTIRQSEGSSPQEARRSLIPKETQDILPIKILSPEEAEADYQKQLTLLRQQTIEYLKDSEATEEVSVSKT